MADPRDKENPNLRPASARPAQTAQQQHPAAPAADVPPVAKPAGIQAPTVIVQQPLKVPKPPGTFGNVASLETFLQEIRDKVHLLSPVTNFDTVPEFHEVSVRYVLVDPRVGPGFADVYEPEPGDHDKVALTKVALDRIAATAGISWDPDHTRRLDDGSDPYYCLEQAVGDYRDIDGTPRRLVAKREVDLRDGAPTIRGWSAGRLARAREYIQPQTESKAKNRVVRQLGVRGSYRPADLWTKPFAIITLVWTGRSDDPQLQLEARRALMHRGLEARHKLFPPRDAHPGERDVTPPAEQVTLAPPIKPPPVSQAAADPGDEAIDATFTPVVPPEEILNCCPEAPNGIHYDGCPNKGRK